MKLFGYFKPNVEKMLKSRDGDGLLRALKHNDVGIRDKADKALKNLAWVEFEEGLKAWGPELRDKAEAHFREAIRLKADEGLFHVRLAATLEAKGQKQEAKSHYEEGMRLMPNDGTPHFFMGNMMRDEGKFSMAREHYIKALSLNIDEKLNPICEECLGLLPEDIDEIALPSHEQVKEAKKRLSLLNGLAGAASLPLMLASDNFHTASVIIPDVIEKFKKDICPRLHSSLEGIEKMFWYDPQLNKLPRPELTISGSIGCNQLRDMCSSVIQQMTDIIKMIETKIRPEN